VNSSLTHPARYLTPTRFLAGHQHADAEDTAGEAAEYDDHRHKQEQGAKYLEETWVAA
jgi:hypothetical protein